MTRTQEAGMDAMRRGFLEASEVSLGIQNAGKAFGFLDDGRDLIDVAEGPDGRVATLRDHTDEGWTEVIGRGRVSVSSADDWWRIVMGSGLRSTVTAVGPDAAARVRRTCEASVAEHSVDRLMTRSRYALATFNQIQV